MAKETRKVTFFICERCGHEWIPRDPETEPRNCASPKCKSPYWNKPRRDPAAATKTAKRK